jgi:hypothetical protein
MSVYPPPLSESPIFNPAFFTETVTSVIGGGSTPTTQYVEFPDAQGAVTFEANGGDNQLVVGAEALTIGYDRLTTPKGIAFSGEGFGYDNGATVSTTTWSNLQIKVQAVSALAPAQDATTLNVNDAICIQNGESPTGTNTIILSTSAGENQLLLNDSAGTEGYVLTSGGPDGSLSWSAGGGGGSQNLASVLTVGSVADLDQSITLSTTSSAEKTNVLDGTGMVVDNVETIDGDTIESKCEISDTLARFSTFNSAQIPSPSIPTYSSLLQADSLVLTDNKYIDSAYITHTLTLEASRIGIDDNFGEVGQVLGKDENNNPAWITGGGGGGTTLEQAITNGGGVATSSFQLNAIDTLDPIYAEMAYDGFVVQNVVNGPLFPPIPTTTTSTLSPASLVLVSAVSGGNTTSATLGVNSLAYLQGDFEAEYDYNHMRIYDDNKGTPISTYISPNDITLFDTSFGNSLEISRNKFKIGADNGSAGQVIGKDENNDLAWITAGGGGSQNLASVLDVEPAGLADVGQNINIPAGDIAQYIGVNSFMSGDALYISANETSTPNEITDYTGFNIEGFSTFRIDTISDPQTQVQTDMTPASTNIKNISGDPSTTATQLLNTQNATSITLQSDSIVSSVSTTDKSAILTADSLDIQDFSSEDLGVLTKNSLEFTHITDSETDTSILLENGESPSLTLTYNFYSEDPVITSTNVISPTTMVITNGNIPQTTTFSATGMGTGSTTQPLNINAPFTLVSPVIDTPDLPLCYTPYAGYGDALIVYNNVGIVPEVSNGYAEVIFQNISATSQSSNITAICESDGDYMTMGQVSQTGTALYNTFFEIQGAGYMSSTGHQIIGANSAGSADKSVVISYGNGTAGGFQVSPTGAIGFDATPLVVDGVVSLQDAEFGNAGQFLISQGDTLPPVWTSPSTQQIVSTSGNVNSTLSINSVIGVLVITPTAGTTAGRTFNLPNPPPPVGYVLSVNNLSGVGWTLATTETNGYLIFQANRASTISIGINASGVLRYLGNIDFSGTIRPCWSL